MKQKTYDGTTTALRRHAKRWKALAKRLRESALYASRLQRKTHRELELAIEHNKALRDREPSDGAMVLTLQLKELREKYDRDISDKEVGHQLEMAEARAAREQAENALYLSRQGRNFAELRLKHAEQAEAVRTWQRDKAERERDTALALSTERYQELCRQAQRATDAESALASAQAYAVSCSRNSQEDSARRESAETALASAEARVRELEAEVYALGEGNALRNMHRMKEKARAEAAETALLKAEETLKSQALELASARATLEKLDSFVRAEMPGSWRSILLGIIHTSHPAPVAAEDANMPLGPQEFVPTPDHQGYWTKISAPVAAPCAGCAEYQILVENLKFRLKMAEDSNPDNVLSKHNAMLMAIAHADEYKRDWEGCHRQHEQCMKLLEKCSLRLSPGNLRDLVREMLSKGELPEGWDK